MSKKKPAKKPGREPIIPPGDGVPLEEALRRAMSTTGPEKPKRKRRTRKPKN